MARVGTRRALVSRPAVSGGNGLLNNLIAYWKLDEASGDALDAHTNGLTLTDTNTVTSNTGKVYALARQYTPANSEYHTRPGDDALLSAGDVDLTIMVWVYFANMSASIPIIAKTNAGPNYEYRIRYSTVTSRVRFDVSNDGTALVQCPANTLGVPNISTWYLFVAWHDSIANTINIQANNGAVDSVSHTTGIYDGTNELMIGWDRTDSANYMYGRVGPVAIWKSAAGAGGVLTTDQRTALYNSGAGLAYASFTT